MLHWLRNWAPKSYSQFWYQLILVSLIGHLIFLFLFFFRNGHEHLKLTIFSRSKPIDVVFVPLYKKVAGVQKQIAKSKSSSKSNKLNVVRKKNIVKKRTVQKKVVKQRKDKVVKKAKPKLKKKEGLKLKQQAVKMKSKPKSKLKPEEIIKKKVSSKPKTSVDTKKDVKEVLKEEPIFVGRKDLKGLQIAKEIEKVVAKTWHPPVGFAADTECVVQITVDGQGKATDYVITKRSGVLAYDMSVRQSIPKIIFPQSVRSKTLTIVFKQ